VKPPTNPNRTTVEKYLEQEENSEIRSEFVKGLLFPIVGTTRRHNQIVGNLYSLIRPHLKNSPCRVYAEGVKVRIEEENCYYYPDVMVTCDNADADSDVTVAPVFIAEVHSKSTFATDRREKLSNYQLVASLYELLLVHQRRQQVDVYQKDSEGEWTVNSFGCGDSFYLQSMPTGVLKVPVDEIYEDTDAKPVTLVREDENEYETSEEDWDY
jgi:Uncharacterized protein conserved in cyanobacteria